MLARRSVVTVQTALQISLEGIAVVGEVEVVEDLGVVLVMSRKAA